MVSSKDTIYDSAALEFALRWTHYASILLKIIAITLIAVNITHLAEFFEQYMHTMDVNSNTTLAKEAMDGCVANFGQRSYTSDTYRDDMKRISSDIQACAGTYCGSP